MPSVAVVLSDEEQAELRMIVTDGDEAEALRFLKEVVWAQVRAVRNKALRSHLEQGQA